MNMGMSYMISVTLFTQQQQVTVRIICNIVGLDKHYFPNDFINFLLLSGYKCCTYHTLHTHVGAVAVSQSFGRPQYIAAILYGMFCMYQSPA
jgi:hypothetical protein